MSKFSDSSCFKGTFVVLETSFGMIEKETVWSTILPDACACACAKSVNARVREEFELEDGHSL